MNNFWYVDCHNQNKISLKFFKNINIRMRVAPTCAAQEAQESTYQKLFTVLQLRTGSQADMGISTWLVIQIKKIFTYFMGSQTLPSTCYILSYDTSIPFYFNRYKN